MASSAHAKRLERAVHALQNISDPLRRLEAVRHSRQVLEDLEASVVAEARSAGVTWLEIGELYGLTKQGAQQRFRRAKGTTASP